jgi:hypothetical protein
VAAAEAADVAPLDPRVPPEFQDVMDILVKEGALDNREYRVDLEGTDARDRQDLLETMEIWVHLVQWALPELQVKMELVELELEERVLPDRPDRPVLPVLLVIPV